VINATLPSRELVADFFERLGIASVPKGKDRKK
jgi:hypothetical protein